MSPHSLHGAASPEPLDVSSLFTQYLSILQRTQSDSSHLLAEAQEVLAHADSSISTDYSVPESHQTLQQRETRGLPETLQPLKHCSLPQNGIRRSHPQSEIHRSLPQSEAPSDNEAQSQECSRSILGVSTVREGRWQQNRLDEGVYLSGHEGSQLEAQKMGNAGCVEAEGCGSQGNTQEVGHGTAKRGVGGEEGTMGERGGTLEQEGNGMVSMLQVEKLDLDKQRSQVIMVGWLVEQYCTEFHFCCL